MVSLLFCIIGPSPSNLDINYNPPSCTVVVGLLPYNIAGLFVCFYETDNYTIYAEKRYIACKWPLVNYIYIKVMLAVMFAAIYLVILAVKMK